MRRFASATYLVGAVIATVLAVHHMGEPSAKFLPNEVLHFFLGAPTSEAALVQSSTVEIRGINPNEVGGMLTLVIPLAVALSIGGGYLRLVALPSVAILSGALLLTQSRTAVGSVAAALTLGALWALRRRSGIAAALALICVGAGIAVVATLEPQLFAPSFREVPVQAGLRMLIDMPVTGIGLNTFPEILPRFYPAAHEDGATYAHAHNLLLQTWLDLGVLGLLAFLDITLTAVRLGLCRNSDPSADPAHLRLCSPDDWLTLGLLLSLLAYGIFSLADAVTLGAKPGVALWLVLGLLAANETTLSGVPSQLANGLAKARKRVLRWPVVARGGSLVLVGLLTVAPLTVNTARLVLHQAIVSHRTLSPHLANMLDAGLTVGRNLAWGPYRGRVLAARDLLLEAQRTEAQRLERISDHQVQV